jgi:hypothetical protein
MTGLRLSKVLSREGLQNSRDISAGGGADRWGGAMTVEEGAS